MIKSCQILILVFTLSALAQERLKVKGVIVHDSIPLANVHIYNKTTFKGVISDTKGAFEIRIKLGDVLHISAMPYRNVIIKIDAKILEKKQLLINMLQNINVLNEVVINNHHTLSGNLFIDKEKVPKEFHKTVKIDLNLEDVNFNRYADVNLVEDRGLDEVYNTYNFAKIDLLKVAKFIAKKITKKAKTKKKAKLFLQNLPLKIREELGDNFFIKNLHIPKYQIEMFLESVITDELIQLYKQNKKIEWIDLIVKKSLRFNK